MRIDSKSSQGNAFFILGKVKQVMKEQGQDKKVIDKALNDMKSKDYEYLCERASHHTYKVIEVI